MRTFGVVAAVAFGLLSAPVLAQSKQDFSLVNRTGYTISEVYVAPSKSNSWEEDVMGSGVLGNGETVDISFDRGNNTCMWDLKVVYDDNTPAEWSGFDLCKVSEIKIFYNRSQDKTWAEYK